MHQRFAFAYSPDRACGPRGARASPRNDDRHFAACYHQPVDHVARRLEDALELADLAERMVWARLQREHPNLRSDVLEARVRAWLRSRPCAVDGDADGRPVDLEQPT
jgi:hypothetical protein